MIKMKTETGVDGFVERGRAMEMIIATHNPHKLREFQRILGPLGIVTKTASLSEPEETGKSFMENARIKARTACQETGLPAVADDSGICVDALGGEPGIYSARYGGQDLDDGGRLALLLKNMEEVPQEERGAHFTSAICCAFPNGEVVEASGDCFGTLAFAPEGEEGFGYDPIFLWQGRSFGSLSGEEKDRHSHRGQALRLFAVRLTAYLSEKAAKSTEIQNSIEENGNGCAMDSEMEGAKIDK